jgi:hypothetical protein
MTLQKTESFVPLTATATTAEKRDFQVTVIPRTEPARSFQTLGQVASAAAEANAAAGGKTCEPRLTVQRDGDRIANIRVQCSCGQIIELACVYDDPGQKK